MKVFTDLQARGWFKGINRSPQEGEDNLTINEAELFFTHAEASCIHLDYPATLERLPFFARYIATLGNDDCSFSGALMWITGWGFWNALDEGIGYRLMESLNRASGQPMSFEIGQVHAFRADELAESIGMLLQPMIFGWDTYYVPHWEYDPREFFLHISHGSYINVVTRTKQFYDQVFQQLQDMDFSPSRGAEFKVGRFCLQA